MKCGYRNVQSNCAFFSRELPLSHHRFYMIWFYVEVEGETNIESVDHDESNEKGVKIYMLLMESVKMIIIAGE